MDLEDAVNSLLVSLPIPCARIQLSIGCSKENKVLIDGYRDGQHMSENTSDAASQYLLGFLYASGLKGVEQDQSRVSSSNACTFVFSDDPATD